MIQSVEKMVSDSVPGICEKLVDAGTESLQADTFKELLLESTLAGVALVALAFLIFLVINRSSAFFSRLFKGTLTYIFLGVWFAGFVLYDVGMCTGEAISLFLNAPMAMLHAFGMFFLSSDVSEMHDVFFNSWLFMGLYSIVHFLAAIVSLLFIIKHFGFNIIARLRLLSNSFMTKETTYVFWGMNDATFHLAESIREHHDKTGDKDYRIVIVRTNINEENAEQNQTGLERVFDFLMMKNSDLKELMKLDCLTTSTYVNISKVNISDSVASVDVINQMFELKLLSKIIKNKTSKNLHMLLLSDDEKYNLHAVSLMFKDASVNSFVAGSEDRRVIFHCHARYNSVHRVIEDELLGDQKKVKVVDSSHLNVEQLKQTPALQPVNFVKVENDATVSSAFNSLVVGFSEVGQDSVRFLYEFGAFVKTGSTDNIVVRSKFRCHVVDKNMADLAGAFVANTPAICPSLPFINGVEESYSEIVLHQMDCRSVEFYDKMEQWIKALNYIVIATDNDEMNISLGVRLFKLAIRYRGNLDNFCILVRIHNDDDGHIARIAQHYNRLWEAEKSSYEKNRHQKAIRKDDSSFLFPIYLFGIDKSIYTYRNIIENSLENINGDSPKSEAIKFKEVYERGALPDGALPEGYRSAWEADFRKLMQLDGELKDYSPTYTGLTRLRRTQGQDLANAYHKHTKWHLIKQTLSDRELEAWTKKQIVRENGKTTFVKSERIEDQPHLIRVFNVLAQTEHLRWNASHEILGYTTMVGDLNGQDEAKLKHGCLVSWEKLTDEEKRSYDFKPLEVTIDLYTKKQD